jgi:hypothetical protein
MSKYKSPPGTWFEREMFESQAFISLKGFAPQLLVLFLSKRQFQKHGRKGKEKKVCINCDSIPFTYIDAQKKYGVTKSRFSRAIDELLAKGFITIVHTGGGYKQDKTIYALSNAWIHWRSGVVIETRKKETVKRGFCVPKTKVTRESVPIHSHENVPIQGI